MRVSFGDKVMKEDLLNRQTSLLPLVTPSCMDSRPVVCVFRGSSGVVFIPRSFAAAVVAMKQLRTPGRICRSGDTRVMVSQHMVPSKRADAEIAGADSLRDAVRAGRVITPKSGMSAGIFTREFLTAFPVTAECNRGDPKTVRLPKDAVGFIRSSKVLYNNVWKRTYRTAVDECGYEMVDITERSGAVRLLEHAGNSIYSISEQIVRGILKRMSRGAPMETPDETVTRVNKVASLTRAVAAGILYSSHGRYSGTSREIPSHALACALLTNTHIQPPTDTASDLLDWLVHGEVEPGRDDECVRMCMSSLPVGGVGWGILSTKESVPHMLGMRDAGSIDTLGYPVFILECVVDAVVNAGLNILTSSMSPESVTLQVMRTIGTHQTRVPIAPASNKIGEKDDCLRWVDCVINAVSSRR